jgi:hypothetical protein
MGRKRRVSRTGDQSARIVHGPRCPVPTIYSPARVANNILIYRHNRSRHPSNDTAPDALAPFQRIGQSNHSVREPLQTVAQRGNHSEILAIRSRRALPITETELKLIAAAAIIGERSKPNTG